MTDRRPDDEAQAEPVPWQPQEGEDVHYTEQPHTEQPPYEGPPEEATEPSYEPPYEPPYEAPQEPLAQEAEPAREGWPWGLAALAVLLAFVGGLAGAAVWPFLAEALPPSWGLGAGQPPAWEERLTALEEQAAALDPLPERVASLQRSLGDLQALADEPAPPAEVVAQVQSLQQELDRLAAEVAALSQRPAAPAAGDAGPAPATIDRIAALERQLSDLQAQMGEESDGADAEQAVAPLRDRLAALEGRLQQATQGAGNMQALQQQNAGLRQQVAALEARVAEIAQAAEAARAGSRRDALVLAVGQLDDAVRSGDAFADALQAVRSLAPEDQDLASSLEPLAARADQGVPRRADLMARFDEVANAIVGAAASAPEAGWVERTLQRLSSVVTVRRTGDVEGDAADALVARAEMQLERGDLAGAVAALEGLSGPAAEAASPWLQDVRARLAAEAALDALGARAIALVAG